MTDVVDAEVVPEEATQEMVLATIRVTPEQAKAANENIQAVIRSVLQEGRDYMTIPGTGKPSLLKPGAESLQRFFGFGSQLGEIETGNLESGSFYAKVRCSVKNRDGMILGEALGWADQEESKWRKAPRNTVIAMAAKRAFVSAIRTATGTSDVFTSDLEDNQPDNKPAVVEDRLATDQEKLALAELFARKKPGGTITEGAAWIDGHGKNGESRAWVAKQCLNLLLRPDPPASSVSKPSPEDLQRVGPEPELPIPGQTTLADDDIPFDESEEVPF